MEREKDRERWIDRGEGRRIQCRGRRIKSRECGEMRRGDRVENRDPDVME